MRRWDMTGKTSKSKQRHSLEEKDEVMEHSWRRHVSPNHNRITVPSPSRRSSDSRPSSPHPPSPRRYNPVPYSDIPHRLVKGGHRSLSPKRNLNESDIKEFMERKLLKKRFLDWKYIWMSNTYVKVRYCGQVNRLITQGTVSVT